MSSVNLTKRIIDIKQAAALNAHRLINMDSGTWDKYMMGGTTQDEIPAGSDVNIEDPAAIAVLFDRTADGNAFLASIAEEAPAKDSIQAKLASDMLASMQQSMGMRYTSRIRSMCASASRLEAISASDAETLKMKVEDV